MALDRCVGHECVYIYISMWYTVYNDYSIICHHAQEKPTFSRATTPQVRTPQAPLGSDLDESSEGKRCEEAMTHHDIVRHCHRHFLALRAFWMGPWYAERPLFAESLTGADKFQERVWQCVWGALLFCHVFSICYCRFASPFPCLAINQFGPKPVQPLLLAFVPHQPAFRAHTRCGFRVGREELRCHFGSVRCRCDFARKSYAKCCELCGVDKQIEHFGLLAVFEVCLPKKDPWTALIWSASLPWSVRGSGSHRQSLPSSDALPCCPTMLSLHVFFPYSSRYHILGDLRNGKTEWSAPGTDCRPQDTTGSGCGSVGSTTPSPATNSRPETRFGAGMMPQSDLLRASLFQSLSYDQLHVSATMWQDQN